MNVDQLITILNEYPLSSRLNIVVEKKTMLETTVVEMISKLMREPPNASLTFCGRDHCILREYAERIEHQGELVRCHPRWLEMDMR